MAGGSVDGVDWRVWLIGTLGAAIILVAGGWLARDSNSNGNGPTTRSSSSSSSAVTSTSTTVSTTTTTRPNPPPGCPTGPRVNLGLWEYMGNRPPFPPAAGQCEAIVAHGDIDDSGTCRVRVFRQGEAIGGLGSGTFRLVKVSGTNEQIDSAAADIRRTACGG